VQVHKIWAHGLGHLPVDAIASRNGCCAAHAWHTPGTPFLSDDEGPSMADLLILIA
jgi:hypothetical protein